VTSELYLWPTIRATAAVHKLLEMSDSESDSDEEGQAFYVGGSERSGQQVIGPPRQKGKSSNDLIGDMFKSAKESVLIFLIFSFSHGKSHFNILLCV